MAQVVEQGRRSSAFGVIPGVEESCSAQTALEMFRRICLARYFDLQAYDATKIGAITCPIYFSVGQESIAAAVSTVMEGSYIFTQHRGHAVYLAFGGHPVGLIDELLGLETGCCGGMGGSPCIQDRSIKMIGHEGLIGEHVPIAVGAALGAPGDRVVCFFGDGAAEEDYIFGALGFAGTHRLPILFVCEDNDLSVLTPTRDRRAWKLEDVARALGIAAVDVTDDPWLIRYYAGEYARDLPALINCRTCRVFWHVGAGQDAPPEWDRFALVKQTLSQLGLAGPAQQIETETQRYIEGLWKERLQIRSER